MTLRPDEQAWIDTHPERCGACGHLLMLHHNEWCCDGDCCDGQSCNVGDCKCSGEKWQGARQPRPAGEARPSVRDRYAGRIKSIEERPLPAGSLAQTTYAR